jgi:hypothetical protein
MTLTEALFTLVVAAVVVAALFPLARMYLVAWDFQNADAMFNSRYM